MSAAKLLLKIRRLAHSSFSSAILIILITFGLIMNASGDIAPNEDSDSRNSLKTEAVFEDTNSISSNLENLNKNNIENPTKDTTIAVTDLGFIHAFIASISVILVSELGDKTFFIAAIMAMRHPRLTVFTGAIAALALMTVLSAVFGMAATIIPRVYTYYISTALFAIFGLKMLKEGYYMSPTDAQEELEEVQSDLRKREDELMRSVNKTRKDDDDDDLNDESTHVMIQSNDSILANNNNTDVTSGDKRLIDSSQSLSQMSSNHNGIATILSSSNLELNTTNINSSTTNTASVNGDISANGMELIQIGGAKKRLERESMTSTVQDPESGVIRKVPKRSAYYLASRIFMQAFTMTFLAEWGDRSQLTTIILGAREDVYGVIVGGVLGHSICTGLAVIGGRMIAQRISVRTVTLVGGVVFLLFAVSALFFDPNDD